ncbi:Ribokinase-like protein [Lentinula lateritia]|nr:Ribokinase-like protein [Lentinula lateritia]
MNRMRLRGQDGGSAGYDDPSDAAHEPTRSSTTTRRTDTIPQLANFHQRQLGGGAGSPSDPGLTFGGGPVPGGPGPNNRISKHGSGLPMPPPSPGMNKDGSAKDINMKIEGSPRGGLPPSSAGMAPTASGPANGPSSMPVPPGRPPSSQNPAPNSGPHPGMPSLPPPNMDHSPGSMLGNTPMPGMSGPMSGMPNGIGPGGMGSGMVGINSGINAMNGTGSDIPFFGSDFMNDIEVDGLDTFNPNLFRDPGGDLNLKETLSNGCDHPIRTHHCAGYGRSGGSKTSAAELESIFQAMEFNELLRPTRVLTGYIPDAEALTAVARLVEKLRKQNPELIHMLDRRLYVSADVVSVYRSLLPLSTIITPNWFEVEMLTGISLTDLHSLRHALTKLHKDFGVPNVAISSIPLTQWLSEALPNAIRPPSGSESEHLLCITSSVSNKNSPSDVHAQCVPLLPGYFSGVGDLFSSLVLAHYNPSLESSLPEVHLPFRTSLSEAVSQALTKTHAVLCKTFEYSERLPEEERLVTDDEKDAVEPIRKV